jgi:hypothetical protein
MRHRSRDERQATYERYLVRRKELGSSKAAAREIGISVGTASMWERTKAVTKPVRKHIKTSKPVTIEPIEIKASSHEFLVAIVGKNPTDIGLALKTMMGE